MKMRNGYDWGATFSEREENGGDESSKPTQQEANDEYLRNV